MDIELTEAQLNGDDEPMLPGMQDKGRILFHYDPSIGGIANGIEIIDYDDDKSPFWLHEAGFMDYAVDDMVNLELEGYYVIEGITGYGHTDYWGEYDETWEFEYCRRASEQEIVESALQ